MDLIVEDDFKVEEGSVPGRYNLYLSAVINKGKDNERVDYKLHGYDMHMESIVKLISHIRTDKEIKEPVKLLDYIKLYLKTIKQIVNLFNYEEKDVQSTR